MSLDEDRHLQHQQRQPAAAQSAAVAATRPSPTSSVCRSSNAPMRSFPAEAIRKAGYHAGVERPAHLERRRHPLARRRARRDAHGLARRSVRHAGALHRGGRRRRSWSAASICPTAIRNPGRSSTTSWPGSNACRRTRASCSRKMCPSSSRATTTSRRPRSTSTRPLHGTMMRSCSRKAARLTRSSSRRAGPMPSASCIRTSASIRSGTI